MPGVAVADDGYARHGVDESHDIQGWAILLINTIILSLIICCAYIAGLEVLQERALSRGS